MQPDMSVWQGRVDANEGPLAVRWHQRVSVWTEQSPAGIALVGLACDEGIRRNLGRPGAAAGPRAIRAALANLAWRQQVPVYDAGDVACEDGDLETAQAALGARITRLVTAGQRPLVLGGGHETAFGTFLGLVGARPQTSIGIINLDAHFDMRENDRATSGTPFSQMAAWCRSNGSAFHYLCLGIAESANTEALFQRARSLGARWYADLELSPWRLAEALLEVDSFARSVDFLYLSIDLDVLPGSTMPAVSAPAALGVSLEAVEIIVKAVLATGRTAAVDVVEFNPAFDHDGLAARVAARIVWQIARHWP